MYEINSTGKTTSLYVGTIVSSGNLAHLFCAVKSGFSLFFCKDKDCLHAKQSLFITILNLNRILITDLHPGKEASRK